MHSELRDGLHTQQVDYYDGQSIFCNSQLCYSLGEYLGGGTAGVYVELSYSSICVRLLDLVQAVSTKLFAIEQIVCVAATAVDSISHLCQLACCNQDFKSCGVQAGVSIVSSTLSDCCPREGSDHRFRKST